MSIHNLDHLFKPQRVAVVGASNTPGKVAYTVFRNLRSGGNDATPVNPGEKTVQGIRAFARVTDLPEAPDLVIICTPAKTVAGIIVEAAEAGTRAAVVLSAGFGEVGGDGRALEKDLGRIAARYDHFRILSPNCLGFIAPHAGINASFGGDIPKAGHVAFVSQSGALCTAVLDWAHREEIGFSHFVSMGNMLDVDFGDLIDYLNQDAVTRSIILYAESITNARKFMSASRAFAASKPIIIYKGGRFAESALAAASHTGALAGDDTVFDAAFRRAGIVRVGELGEIFDCAELLSHGKRLSGPRLSIVTNAGRPGVIAVDALLARGGELATLADATVKKLDAVLPAAWSHGNPIDVLGDATPDRYRDATEHALNDPATDAVLVILTPQAMTEPTRTADVVGALAQRSGKTILGAWMGGALVQDGIGSGQSVWRSALAGPVNQTLRRPFGVFAMRPRHVFGERGVMTDVGSAPMTGNRPAAMEDLHHTLGEPRFGLALHQLIRHRVITPLYFYVIIDTDTGLFPNAATEPLESSSSTTSLLAFRRPFFSAKRADGNGLSCVAVA